MEEILWNDRLFQGVSQGEAIRMILLLPVLWLHNIPELENPTMGSRMGSQTGNKWKQRSVIANDMGAQFQGGMQ